MYCLKLGPYDPLPELLRLDPDSRDVDERFRLERDWLMLPSRSWETANCIDK